MAGPSFPLLVADIGGTHARFGWVRDAGASLSDVQTLLCVDYDRPHDAAIHYLSHFHSGASPSRVVIAIASAISSGPIKVTNSAWTLDRVEFATHTGVANIEVFNDFEAIALILPHMAATDYQLIGPSVPNPNFAMAVIGPGTGLGVAGIIPVSQRPGTWQTVCGEGGHVTLCAASTYQSDLLRVAGRAHTHISAERLVSGLGLPALRRAVAEVEGLPIEQEMDAEQIGTLGSTRSDVLCEHTMEAFCSLLGLIAGNLALTLGARGGIFIAGGIVPKLGAFFGQSGFRTQFEAKGRYINYQREICTAVITTPYPGLRGLVSHVMRDSAQD